MKQLRVYIIAAFLLLLIVCVLKFKQQNSQHVFPASSNREAVVSNPQTNVSKEDGLKATKEAAIPSYVIETLNYILKYDKAPKGYVGGRIYFNRNKVLPQKMLLKETSNTENGMYIQNNQERIEVQNDW